MKLSTRVEYGLRALIELTLKYQSTSDEPLMLQTIAEKQEISKKYLEQLFIPLRKAGIVEGLRGPSGGYRLAHRPEDISLDKIFAILEGSLAVASCLLEPSRCKRSGHCAIQEIWEQVTLAVTDTLSAISLENVTQRYVSLGQDRRAIETLLATKSIPEVESKVV